MTQAYWKDMNSLAELVTLKSLTILTAKNCVLLNSNNASFPYKTVMSEANVKTNRKVSTKWAYHKERSFASNYFIFLKILFQFKNSYKKLIIVPTTQMPISMLSVSAGVLFEGAFSL